MSNDHILELLANVLNELTDPKEVPSIQYLTIGEVSKTLQVSKPTVLTWLKDKKNPLPYFNFGKRQIRIRVDDLEEWTIAHRSKAKERVEKLMEIAK